jgi:hypothetical protein
VEALLATAGGCGGGRGGEVAAADQCEGEPGGDEQSSDHGANLLDQRWKNPKMNDNSRPISPPDPGGGGWQLAPQPGGGLLQLAQGAAGSGVIMLAFTT